MMQEELGWDYGGCNRLLVGQSRLFLSYLLLGLWNNVGLPSASRNLGKRHQGLMLSVLLAVDRCCALQLYNCGMC